MKKENWGNAACSGVGRGIFRSGMSRRLAGAPVMEQELSVSGPQAPRRVHVKPRRLGKPDAWIRAEFLREWERDAMGVKHAHAADHAGGNPVIRVSDADCCKEQSALSSDRFSRAVASDDETVNHALDAWPIQVFGDTGCRLQANSATLLEPLGRLAYLRFDSVAGPLTRKARLARRHKRRDRHRARRSHSPRAANSPPCAGRRLPMMTRSSTTALHCHRESMAASRRAASASLPVAFASRRLQAVLRGNSGLYQ